MQYHIHHINTERKAKRNTLGWIWTQINTGGDKPWLVTVRELYQKRRENFETAEIRWGEFEHRLTQVGINLDLWMSENYFRNVGKTLRLQARGRRVDGGVATSTSRGIDDASRQTCAHLSIAFDVTVTMTSIVTLLWRTTPLLVLAQASWRTLVSVLWPIIDTSVF